MEALYYCELGKNNVEYVGQGSKGEAKVIADGKIKMVSDNNDNTMVAQADGTWAVDFDLTKKSLTDAVQAKLDSEAQALGYDSIVSACSYAGFANPFKAEGESFVAWRGNVWQYCYAELDKVIAGTRTLPTPKELVAELPLRVA